ncbi:MAG: ABC transporter ATP-binding protein [Deltaproteobacteria bacterium]|nr:ABC transporter ATP-binding protein [Deltaproteobacteria bacterium]
MAGGLLELREINACYGPVRALRNILLRIDTGNIVSVIGARGAGKSTLLKVISGITRSTGGTIRFQDRDITHSSTMEIVERGISQVPEGGQLFTQLPVLDNLRLGAYFYHNRKFKPDLEERLAWVYQVFPPLRRLANRLAGTLGREEQQMAAIGRALMARPKLLLLDEPSRGLPLRTVREIFRLVRRLNDQGITILLAERNFREALEIAHYGYLLGAGVVVREGTAGELLADG